MSNSLKFPIGKFTPPEVITQQHINSWIQSIAQFPDKLNQLTENLSEAQIDSNYRPRGWTIRQLIHHCADSHHNSYIRFKWTLTENTPVIKAYDQDAWGALEDAKHAPIQISITYLEALHAKWVYVLKTLNDTDLDRCYIHPESKAKFDLKTTIGMYAWHCEHHYAHIYNHLKLKNWI